MKHQYQETYIARSEAQDEIYYLLDKYITSLDKNSPEVQNIYDNIISNYPEYLQLLGLFKSSFSNSKKKFLDYKEDLIRNFDKFLQSNPDSIYAIYSKAKALLKENPDIKTIRNESNFKLYKIEEAFQLIVKLNTLNLTSQLIISNSIKLLNQMKSKTQDHEMYILKGDLYTKLLVIENSLSQKKQYFEDAINSYIRARSFILTDEGFEDEIEKINETIVNLFYKTEIFLDTFNNKDLQNIKDIPYNDSKKLSLLRNIYNANNGNIDIFEEYGKTLETQNPKAATKFYLENIPNTELFDYAKAGLLRLQRKRLVHSNQVNIFIEDLKNFRVAHPITKVVREVSAKEYNDERDDKYYINYLDAFNYSKNDIASNIDSSFSNKSFDQNDILQNIIEVIGIINKFQSSEKKRFLIERTYHLSYSHPAKFIALGHLYTLFPNDVAILEEYGHILEVINPKFAKAFYLMSLNNSNFFYNAKSSLIRLSAHQEYHSTYFNKLIDELKNVMIIDYSDSEFIFKRPIQVQEYIRKSGSPLYITYDNALNEILNNIQAISFIDNVKDNTLSEWENQQPLIFIDAYLKKLLRKNDFKEGKEGILRLANTKSFNNLSPLADMLNYYYVQYSSDEAPKSVSYIEFANKLQPFDHYLTGLIEEVSQGKRLLDYMNR
ncbi:MAG: hypothetical protein ACK4OM_03725 [Alphaproteobacteria bacterium]